MPFDGEPCLKQELDEKRPIDFSKLPFEEEMWTTRVTETNRYFEQQVPDRDTRPPKADI